MSAHRHQSLEWEPQHHLASAYGTFISAILGGCNLAPLPPQRPNQHRIVGEKSFWSALAAKLRHDIDDRGVVALLQKIDNHLVIGSIGLIEDMVRVRGGVLSHFIIRPELM